jgi:hypothetical protein
MGRVEDHGADSPASSGVTANLLGHRIREDWQRGKGSGARRGKGSGARRGKGSGAKSTNVGARKGVGSQIDKCRGLTIRDWSRRSPTSHPCSRSPSASQGPSLARARAQKGNAFGAFLCGPGGVGVGGGEMSPGHWAGGRSRYAARGRRACQGADAIGGRAGSTRADGAGRAAGAGSAAPAAYLNVSWVACAHRTRR